MDWFDIIFYCIVGVFGIKTVFYDFPIFANARSWPNYFKKVSIIILIFLTWFGFGYLGEKHPGSTFVLVLFVVIVLAGIMFYSSNANHKEEDESPPS
jgi:uncharacterized membrane protein YuzA (DUF378 family)